ncbi:MAG: hypothetical protein QXX51_07025 [Candidatus Bathyarchaeia archaeon]
MQRLGLNITLKSFLLPKNNHWLKNLGVPAGLTLFVFVINIPVYTLLSFNSHVFRLPKLLLA